MGYSCPVCEDPQADGVHLANHLAFTAMVRGGDHEAYLDEHVPGWAELSEDELAAELGDVAEETEYPQVFEDTTEEGHEHDEHDHAHEHGGHDHARGGQGGHDHGSPAGRSGPGDAPLPSGTSVPEPSPGDETEEILEEARELTRKRREGGNSDGERSPDGSTEHEAEESETE